MEVGTAAELDGEEHFLRWVEHSAWMGNVEEVYVTDPEPLSMAETQLEKA